jgi:hypothetical protein
VTHELSVFEQRIAVWAAEHVHVVEFAQAERAISRPSACGEFFVEFSGDPMHVRRFTEGLGMFRIVHIDSLMLAKLMQHLNHGS